MLTSHFAARLASSDKDRCAVAGKGVEIVKEIEAVSLAGRAPRQGPGLFALAIVLVYTNTRAQDFSKDAEKRKVGSWPCNSDLLPAGMD